MRNDRSEDQNKIAVGRRQSPINGDLYTLAVRSFGDRGDSLRSDLAEFDSRLITGEPTIEPRMVPAPVRLPLPPALRQGSIYENQTVLKNRYFGIKTAAT